MNWFLILEIIYYLFLIAIAIKIINDTQSSTKAAAYILMLFILPVVGVIIYLSVGLNYRKSGMYSKKLEMDEDQSEKVDNLISSYVSDNKASFKTNYSEFLGLNRMLYKDNQNFATVNNKVKLLVNGEQKFPELLEAMRNAKLSFHPLFCEWHINIIVRSKSNSRI